MKLRLTQLLYVVLLACAFVVLADGRAEAEEVLASYYGPELAGQPTASGEIFDPYGYTAAHKTLPLGTQLVVSYGGQSVEVTVNDRGPYVGGRELDLSQGAAEYLGLTQAGVDYVDYYVVAEGVENAGGYNAAVAAYDSSYSTEGTYDQNYSIVYDSSSSNSTNSPYYSGIDQLDQTMSYAETGNSETESYSSGTTGGSDGETYVVQPNDTLSGIAAQLDTTVEDLAAANGITDVNLIQVGQTLHY